MQTCQPVKDKNRTVAGNGECRRHEDMLAGSEACSSPKSFESPPFSWHLVRFQARNVEKVITVTPWFTLVYSIISPDEEPWLARNIGHHYNKFLKLIQVLSSPWVGETPSFFTTIVYDGRTARFRQNGKNLQEFTQIRT